MSHVISRKGYKKTVTTHDVVRELYRAPATASELASALSMRTDIAEQFLNELCAKGFVLCRPFYAHCSDVEILLYMMPEHAPKEGLC